MPEISFGEVLTLLGTGQENEALEENANSALKLDFSDWVALAALIVSIIAFVVSWLNAKRLRKDHFFGHTHRMSRRAEELQHLISILFFCRLGGGINPDHFKGLLEAVKNKLNDMKEIPTPYADECIEKMKA